MVSSESESQSLPLSLDLLSTPGGLESLALFCAWHLRQCGTVALFLDQENLVQVVPLEELVLDALSEEEAILRLSEAGWDNEQLGGYLKNRDARLRRKPDGQ
jgi:hypothetical protein